MTKKPKNAQSPSSPNSVGYCRPPVAHRFQPGVSGNPAGRPKGSPSIQELIEREARRLVKIKSGHDIVSLPKQEALVRKLYAKALEGDLCRCQAHYPVHRYVPRRFAQHRSGGADRSVRGR